MKKSGVFFLAASLLIASLAEARLYRWVDENGKVQFSDQPPPAHARDQKELDPRGMVRKEPAKRASAGEMARLQQEKQKLIEQKRRDKALLQSFSRPEEIDLLRDRQVGAVRARQQTSKLLRQTAADKVNRLNGQAEALVQAGKSVPETLSNNLLAARKELTALDAEARKMDEEISAIMQRGEADKQRLLELQGVAPR